MVAIVWRRLKRLFIFIGHHAWCGRNNRWIVVDLAMSWLVISTSRKWLFNIPLPMHGRALFDFPIGDNISLFCNCVSVNIRTLSKIYSYFKHLHFAELPEFLIIKAKNLIYAIYKTGKSCIIYLEVISNGQFQNYYYLRKNIHP